MQRRSSDLLRALEALERHGILLMSDARLPSVVSLVVGEPVRGSWWGHARGEEIYQVVTALEDHPDALATKVVSGKVTYVHRGLWPAVLAVARAGEPWQMEGLPLRAQLLLDAVTRNGEMRTDDIPHTGGPKSGSPGEAARELERRLLVHSQEVHTSTGAHAKHLETWDRWAGRVGFSEQGMTAARGKEGLEEAIGRLNARFEGKGRLPWSVT